MNTTTSLQLRIDQGEMTPLHVHPTDETLVALHGRIAVHTGREHVELGADETYVVPAGVPHAVRGLAEVSRYRATAEVRLADRYAEFSLAVARPARAPRADAEDDAVVAWLAAQNGIEVLGPPGALPGGSR